MQTKEYKMKNLVIFDLDDTLSSTEDRAWIAEQKTNTPFGKDYFNHFEAHCVFDEPIKSMIDVLHKHMEDGDEVRFWSGRSVKTKDITIAWLKAHTHVQVPYLDDDHLKMRPIGDYSKSTALKAGWWRELSAEDKARIIMFYDDDDNNINMWKSMGLPATIVTAKQ